MNRVTMWQVAFLVVVAGGERIAHAEGALQRSVADSPIFSETVLRDASSSVHGREDFADAVNDPPWLARRIRICRARRAVAGVRPPALACPLFLASAREEVPAPPAALGLTERPGEMGAD